MTSILSPLFPDPWHKVQLKSNLHKASPSYCWPFCTCSELIPHFLLALHTTALMYFRRLFTRKASVVTLGVGFQKSRVGLWAPASPCSSQSNSTLVFIYGRSTQVFIWRNGLAAPLSCKKVWKTLDLLCVLTASQALTHNGQGPRLTLLGT